MDTQQVIDLALLRHCNEQKISFAFPTQTVHVATLPRESAAGAPREPQHRAVKYASAS